MLRYAVATSVSISVFFSSNFGMAQQFNADEKVIVNSLAPDNNVRATNPDERGGSRSKTLTWSQIIIPSSHDGWPFSQRVSDLKVVIDEVKQGNNGKTIVFYDVSGTLFNATEDDKTHYLTNWGIEFKDAAGTTLDRYSFNLSHDHCSYNGEERFAFPASASAFNFFDAIVSATASGTKPGGYQGPC